MVEQIIHTTLLIVWFVLGVLVFWRAFASPAPYGRYKSDDADSSVESKWGWFVMECPAVVTCGLFFLIGPHNGTAPAYALLGLWMAHYVQRAFLYPFLRRDMGRRMPWRIVALGMVFNVVNGYLNGRYVYYLSDGYPDQWLTDPRFIAGGVLFVAGYAVNRHADYVLHRIRRTGERRYEIPRGGLYRWVSCPNYLGEIVEWVGWAVATWSVAGLAFAFWTAANLAPRAWFHHRWYRDRFAEYPTTRRALVPLVW